MLKVKLKIKIGDDHIEPLEVDGVYYETRQIKALNSGDRVFLVDVERHTYTIGKRNPAVGTEHMCIGTVRGRSGNTVTVDWDNGTSNVYHDFTLALANDGSGICKTIWY